MIYLNNAATTYPKPRSVNQALVAAWQLPPESPFRSSSFKEGNDVMSVCRKNLGLLLGISNFERIYFSSGATDSINRIFGGLELSGLPVVITSTEHNSVLRPLFNNPILAENIHVVDCDGNGKVSPDDIESVLAECSKSKNLRNVSCSGLLILNHCSNVTGAVQEAKRIGEICHKYGFLFMLDVSQSAGCIPIKADSWGVDLLVFTGHKSLFGPQGTGGYYAIKEIMLKPYLFGGTGLDSSRIVYEDSNDYEYEVGTQNIVGIAGLNAGVEYVLGRGIEHIESEEIEKMTRMYDSLSKNPNVTLYGNIQDNRGPVMSFNVKGMKPSDVGYILQNAYDITVRTGLHCSPLIHRALHTEKEGTVRVSISDLTSWSDVEGFLNAVNEISDASH